MKPKLIISLQNRLALTYALFISLTLGILIFIINHFAGLMFNSLVRENIAAKNREIVTMIGEQFYQDRNFFNIDAVETMGMYFAQEGYIITLEDERGNLIWDTRSRNRQQYQNVMRDIADRMEGHRFISRRRFNEDAQMQRERSPTSTDERRIDERRFNEYNQIQRERFPLYVDNNLVGTVSIETFGPIFYSETESAFLMSLNRLLFLAGFVLILLSIVISVLLSRTIAKPIQKVSEAARRIAKSRKDANLGRLNREGPLIRVDNNYHTMELAELSQSINKLAEDLEEGDRRQKQLTSDIAHELRTPLACLQGTIEAMIDGMYAPDEERLESCHGEILRLSRLVEDLNVLTGLEWNNISLEKTEFDLGVLLKLTAEQWKPSAMEKGISINTELIEAPVFADYNRLQQVFINLLSNAVKYTDRGDITITIKPLNLEGAESGWIIRIADTGIGIPEADLPKIFERFYRTDKSRNRKTGGAGIGLSIASAIIAAHGGLIRAERAPSGGTVFYIQLSAITR